MVDNLENVYDQLERLGIERNPHRLVALCAAVCSSRVHVDGSRRCTVRLPAATRGPQMEPGDSGTDDTNSVEPIESTPKPSYPQFWSNLVRAVGGVPGDLEALRGASGISHQVVVAGADDAGQRLIVISAAGDARTAALAHADLQTAFAPIRVILARPVVIDLPKAAAQLSRMIGRTTLSSADLSAIPGSPDQEAIQEAIQPYIDSLGQLAKQWFDNAAGVQNIGFVIGFLQFVDQMRLIKFDSSEGLQIDLSGLVASSSTEPDELFGICPVPLHSFSGEEMETVSSGRSIDEVVGILRRQGIYQYFFPPADQLALGLADRTTATASQLMEALGSAPKLGHPFGENEVLPAGLRLAQVVDALMDRKLLVAGEVDLKVSQEGEKLRAKVKFGPRESVVSKVINRLNVHLDLKAIFDQIKFPPMH